jgi:predicted transcriptional regulator
MTRPVCGERRKSRRRSIRFDDELWERLGIAATRTYRTRPELIHKACEELLARLDPPPARRRQ